MGLTALIRPIAPLEAVSGVFAGLLNRLGGSVLGSFWSRKRSSRLMSRYCQCKHANGGLQLINGPTESARLEIICWMPQ